MGNGSRIDEPGDTSGVRASFDATADAYARVFARELDEKPFDRELLAAFAASRTAAAGSAKPVGLDLGTGAAGHVGRFIGDLGWEVTGVDISPASVDIARRLNPGMAFVVADFRSLPVADGSIDGIVAFYSLIYGTDADIRAGLAEARRVLRPGGRILAAVHGALDDRPTQHRFTEFEGTAVDLVMRYTSPATFAALAESAGLRVLRLDARDPYPFEHASRRIYLLADRP